MSKLLNLEIFLLVLSQFLDFVTTLHVLSIGGYEANPVVALLMQYSGVYGFFLVKLLLIMLIPPAVIALFQARRHTTLAILRATNVFYFFVISSNLHNFIS